MLDRSNIGNANLTGFSDDLGLVGNQYGAAVSVVYATYVVSIWCMRSGEDMDYSFPLALRAHVERAAQDLDPEAADDLLLSGMVCLNSWDGICPRFQPADRRTGTTRCCRGGHHPVYFDVHHDVGQLIYASMVP